ncbi:MAG: carbohydrate-binding domain-containing protein [Prevotella sp.]|nr:carbohydrate-binding domain-containing protein [Prevotella sp.]
MKQFLPLLLMLLMSVTTSQADNNVTIVYNGTSATVTIDDNLSNYVTCTSGTSSHVQLFQSDDVSDTTIGEIYYAVSGSTTAGSLYLKGSYKCEIDLNGVSIANPDSAAIYIDNGKRVAISAKKGSTNTLTDGSSYDAKGALRCKGHLKLKGTGTLNITGNTAHAIWSKEYCEVKKLTLNILGAVKDGINCNQYFSMESGTVTISNVSDDGIQVSIKESDTGEIEGHEDEANDITEDSGTFYQEDGTLTISSFGSKAIKAEGDIHFNGGTQSGFSTTDDVKTYASSSDTGISTVTATQSAASEAIYDLQGRQVTGAYRQKGIYIKGGKKYILK